MLRIVGGSSPIYTPHVPRSCRRASQRRWRKDALRTRSVELVLAPLQGFRSRSPGIGRRDFFWNKRDGRKRLRGPRLLAGNIRLRERTFFHWKQRRAREPVQDKHMAHFGIDHYSRSSVLPGE